MGGYNEKEPLIPRLKEAVDALHDSGHDELSEVVEEAIAVLEGRLVLVGGMSRPPE